MPNQNLINYIKESKEKGFPDKEIRKALLDAGWKKEDVSKGFKVVREVKKIAKKPKSKWLVLVIVVIVIIVVAVVSLIVALNFDTIKDWFKLAL